MQNNNNEKYERDMGGTGEEVEEEEAAVTHES